jgi:hypothetical protein
MLSILSPRTSKNIYREFDNFKTEQRKLSRYDDPQERQKKNHRENGRPTRQTINQVGSNALQSHYKRTQRIQRRVSR